MRREARFAPSHRWRVLGIGVAANAVVAAAFGGIPATAVFIRSGYKLTNTTFGWVIAAMGLGLALSELPWGLVTDRLGDRKVLLTGLGLTGLVLALMALFVSPRIDYAPATMLLGAGLLFMGIVSGSVNGSSGRAVMAWFQESERGLAMSLRQVSIPMGGAVGALILPTTAEYLGLWAVYGVLAAFCFLVAAFAWEWLYEPPTPRAASSTQTERMPQRSRGPLGNIQIWRTVCGLGALCVPQVVVVTFAAVFLNDVAHLSTAAISASIVIFQTGAAIMRVWSGRFTDRHKNRRPFLKACALLTALLFGGLGLLVGLASVSPDFAGVEIGGAVLLVVVGGIAASAWHGIAYTELATIAGMQHVGTALGLGNTFAFGTYFVAPLLVPVFLHAMDWEGVWFAAAVSAFVASVLFPKSTLVAQRLQ